jgi:hypothetical protein
MYWWKYVEGIEPIRESNAFFVGKLAHSMLEHYYQCHNRAEVLSKCAEMVQEGINNYAPEEQEDFTIMAATAMAMFEFFPEEMLDPVDCSVVERNFEILIMDTDKDRIAYNGYIDRVFNSNVIREVKTTANPEMFVRYAAVSPQVTGYILAARHFLNPKINGATFDLILKPLLRKKQTENCEEFCARIREDYKTRPEHYYRREHTFRSDKQLEDFHKDLISIAVDILSKYKSEMPETFWRNHESCFRMGECPYYKICFDNDEMTRSIFYKPVVKEEEPQLE